MKHMVRPNSFTVSNILFAGSESFGNVLLLLLLLLFEISLAFSLHFFTAEEESADLVPGELCFPVCSSVMLAGRSSCGFVDAGSKQTQTKEAQPACGPCPGGHNGKGCSCEGYGARLTSFSPLRGACPSGLRCGHPTSSACRGLAEV